MSRTFVTADLKDGGQIAIPASDIVLLWSYKERIMMPNSKPRYGDEFCVVCVEGGGEWHVRAEFDSIIKLLQMIPPEYHMPNTLLLKDQVRYGKAKE